MKKFKTLSLAIAVVILGGILTGCFGPSYKSFQVQYTPNLELLIGEEWHDDLIKGIATKSDDTEVDVTDKMTIDTSEYNKDVAGKYKIYFEFEGIKVNYEVSVVEQITNSTFITSRLQNVYENSFVAKDGVLSFDATYSNTITVEGEQGKINQYLLYRENNGELDVYYKWEVEDATETASLLEMWYQDTKTNGVLTVQDAEGNVVVYEESELYDVDVFNYSFGSTMAETFTELDSYIDIETILSQKDEIFTGTLTKNQDLYALNTSYGAVCYKNNKIINAGGIEFEYDTTETIPTTPEVEEV